MAYRPIYRGIGFPFRRGPAGFPMPVTDDDLLWDSLVQLILTGAGERVMRLDAGSQVLRFIFEADNVLLGELIAADVAQLVARYEPRVLLQTVKVESVTPEEGEITLRVVYINRATGRIREGEIALPGREA